MILLLDEETNEIRKRQIRRRKSKLVTPYARVLQLSISCLSFVDCSLYCRENEGWEGEGGVEEGE